MTPDHSALIERLEAHMGKADMAEVLGDCRLAAAALRDQQSKMQMMQACLDRWEPKPDTFSNWLVGRQNLPSTPNQAKALK